MENTTSKFEGILQRKMSMHEIIRKQMMQFISTTMKGKGGGTRSAAKASPSDPQLWDQKGWTFTCRTKQRKWKVSTAVYVIELDTKISYHWHIIVKLANNPSKSHKQSVAELSCLEHVQKERIRQKARYKGRTQKNEAHNAVYHNWFSPFLWSQIDRAVTHPSVGRNWSTWHLVKVLQQKDPINLRNCPSQPLKAG